MSKANKANIIRIYPTKEQQDIFSCWEGACRFLWNLGLHQREISLKGYEISLTELYYMRKYNREFWGVPRKINKPIYMKNISKEIKLSQNKQMTELMEELVWLKEIPCDIRQNVFDNLNIAWNRVFAKLSRKVFYKNSKDNLSCYLTATNNPFNLTGDRLTGKLIFKSPASKKLGAIKIAYDRKINGKVTSWRIQREIDEWYAVASFETDIKSAQVKNGKSIGIDRGVTDVIADSDGKIIQNPKFLAKMQLQIKRAQRQLNKKKKGSNNSKKARLKLAKLQRIVTRQREVFIHTQSLYYAKNYEKVIIEKLEIQNMTASAKGTFKNPGKNIKQKSGLNKSISDAGWGKFELFVDYKLKERGGELIKVIANYSSQECSACGYCDKNNRNRKVFCCLKCGHKEDADLNAAKVIKSRGFNVNQIVQAKEKKSVKNKRKTTTVKPTVLQPAEDNSIVSLLKNNDQEPVEPGTAICEDRARKQRKT